MLFPMWDWSPRATVSPVATDKEVAVISFNCQLPFRSDQLMYCTPKCMLTVHDLLCFAVVCCKSILPIAIRITKMVNINITSNHWKLSYKRNKIQQIKTGVFLIMYYMIQYYRTSSTQHHASQNIIKAKNYEIEVSIVQSKTLKQDESKSR